MASLEQATPAAALVAAPSDIMQLHDGESNSTPEQTTAPTTKDASQPRTEEVTSDPQAEQASPTEDNYTVGQEEPKPTGEEPAAAYTYPEATEGDPYPLENVKVTAIPADEIDKTFRSTCIDMISATMGGKILAFSDEWFAEAANLLTPTAPIRQPGKMVYTGAWYDGWETRRHNREPFDWVIVRLGVASGTVAGIEVDTTFFSGNHAPAVSVEGCFSASDDDVVGWGGSRGGWETILGLEECGPSHRFAWKLDDGPTARAYTHVRLNMYPDGGIARFRLFGHAVPVFPDDKGAVLDLAAAQNGGVAVACSDQHFGTKDNLVLPGRGRDMGDGWETARSRGKGHVDWAVIRLGAPAGHVSRVVVDTAHFRGNFPQKVTVEAIRWEEEDGSVPPVDDKGWKTIVAPSKCGPDQEHEFECQADAGAEPVTHVKLVIIPDGGVKRLRVFGSRMV